MYRVLDAHQEVRERRNQLRHPVHDKPHVVATAPNQVWTWNITKLLGPAKWTSNDLYVILDIFSRYVVGWMLASGQSQDLAERLIRQTVIKEGIGRDQLTIHSDRGAAMRSQAVVHTGQATVALEARASVLAAAHARHSERFVRGVPRPLTPAAEVWINQAENRPTVRTLELPRDTQFVPQLSQRH